jgi:hypothetical protein
MKKRFVALAATLALVSAGPAASLGSTPAGPVAVAAKSCSAGYTHAVINGAHKCLRRGQFCAGGSDGQYHRYGFHCHNRDARGNYHLS